jgi:hypothetical protein
VTPCYFVLDCIPTADGAVRVIDARGGVGGGLTMLASAYGGKAAARSRLRPYLERLGEVAGGRRILFLHDPFSEGQTFPDDFFNWVQRFIQYGPITDWVPDLEAARRQRVQSDGAPEVEQMGVFLDPLAARLRLKIAYCATARVDYEVADGEHRPRLLLSGYRERARRRPNSVILPPEEVGVLVFSGASARFPDGLTRQSCFPVVNPPPLDRFLENRWLLPLLLEGTPSAALLPRWIPVGMGMRTGAEVMDFTRELNAPGGFPLAVLKPSHANLSPGVRFLDRTALRALAARQPQRRLPPRLAEELLAPRVSHSYEEVSGYRGKLLDNLLRTRGAEVHDHGDGTFHYSAPYPFLQATVALLQEYVEARPIRSRRTGRFHRGILRVVMFDGKIVAAIYRLDPETDNGIFHDLTRAESQLFYEGAPPEEEAALQAQLGPFVEEVERQFRARAQTAADLERLREAWVAQQVDGR